MDEETGRLFMRDEEITAVYYRAGYSPADYTSADDWEARIILEKSRAIKCPSIDLQLVTCKTFQHLCGKGEFLSKYAGEKDASKIGHLFKGLWSLADKDDETLKAVERAITDPARFIIKPEREGGGNNIYGEHVKELLLGGKSLSQYLLMERIFPPEVDSLMFREGQVYEKKAVGELGIYGAVICDTSVQDGLTHNETIGCLLRTKDI